ncbi:MAG: hypothetical protein U0163_11845 [Gemmatimonadaceae bacterium]
MHGFVVYSVSDDWAVDSLWSAGVPGLRMWSALQLAGGPVIGLTVGVGIDRCTHRQ